MPDLPSRATQLGALVFLLRPTYIAAEVVTAAATTGGYSFVSDSVSRLGEVGCSAAYCSPRHEVMNGSFMAYGVEGRLIELGHPAGDLQGRLVDRLQEENQTFAVADEGAGRRGLLRQSGSDACVELLLRLAIGCYVGFAVGVGHLPAPSGLSPL